MNATGWLHDGSFMCQPEWSTRCQVNRVLDVGWIKQMALSMLEAPLPHPLRAWAEQKAEEGRTWLILLPEAWAWMSQNSLCFIQFSSIWTWALCHQHSRVFNFKRTKSGESQYHNYMTWFIINYILCHLSILPPTHMSSISPVASVSQENTD